MSFWTEFWNSFINCGHYKQLYEDTLNALEVCVSDRLTCLKQKHELEQQNEQLKLLVPRPSPPKIDYVVERDSLWVKQRLESLGLNIIRLPLDAKYRFTNKKNFMNILTWDTTDQLQYVRNFFDCPDFAMHFMVITNLIFRIQVCWVIDYKSAHSYNLVLFPDDNVFILEPQSDGMYLWTQRPEQFYHLKGAHVAI